MIGIQICCANVTGGGLSNQLQRVDFPPLLEVNTKALQLILEAALLQLQIGTYPICISFCDISSDGLRCTAWQI